jgi:hypothetical protein
MASASAWSHREGDRPVGLGARARANNRFARRNGGLCRLTNAFVGDGEVGPMNRPPQPAVKDRYCRPPSLAGQHFIRVCRDRPDQEPARVSRVDRGICTLLAADGTRRASIGGALLAAAAHDPTRLPCAGDWTVVRTWPDERLTIEAVLPRRTALIRASAGAEALGQILVANVDTVAPRTG